ncbi:DUF5081 family protein [Clostridium paraputrificum]|uniref:DUF5081 family protein n=1 Tax=Clostridium paraputrificum TaxID=29363 RepID=UPI003D335850
MLKASEIYLLNEALDGEEIYGIDKSEALKNNLNSSIKAIESLRNKKIVNEDNTINELSNLIIKNLDKFKKAKSYLWINDILISIDDTNYMIFFRKDIESEEFEFKKIGNFQLIYSILKEYSFLGRPNKTVSDERETISVEEFIDKHLANKNENEILILRKEENSRIKYTSYYVTFILENEKVYKYDAIKGELCEINPQKARIEISKLLGLEVK